MSMHTRGAAAPRTAASRSAGSSRPRRVVSPRDVAALAAHLMTNTALTGATYDIDGGHITDLAQVLDVSGRLLRLYESCIAHDLERALPRCRQLHPLLR